MKRMVMRIALFFCSVLLAVMVRGAAVEREGGPDEKAVKRIELAFAAGLGRAATPLETYECLRIRNAELENLIEKTYAATLAWFAGHREMIDALEKDQARWLADLAMAEAVWGNSVNETIASQALLSTMLLERLRLFNALTADAAFMKRDG